MLYSPSKKEGSFTGCFFSCFNSQFSQGGCNVWVSFGGFWWGAVQSVSYGSVGVGGSCRGEENLPFQYPSTVFGVHLGSGVSSYERGGLSFDGSP